MSKLKMLFDTISIKKPLNEYGKEMLEDAKLAIANEGETVVFSSNMVKHLLAENDKLGVDETLDESGFIVFDPSWYEQNTAFVGSRLF